jgi:NADH-quinone oxidoreductase subunit E
VEPSRVRSLLGFYTLLRRQPGGGWLIHVCTDLPCALRGAEALLDRLCARLSVEIGGSTADGLFTVESAMCLAACDRAPVMQVNLAYAYDLDDAALDAVLADLRRNAACGPATGPPFGLVPPLADQPPTSRTPGAGSDD